MDDSWEEEVEINPYLEVSQSTSSQASAVPSDQHTSQPSSGVFQSQDDDPEYQPGGMTMDRRM